MSLIGRSLRFDDVVYDWVTSTRINLLIVSPAAICQGLFYHSSKKIKRF